MKLPSVVWGAMEIAMNRMISRDLHALEQCEDMAGSILRFRLLDLDLDFTVMPSENGLHIIGDKEEPADVTLSGNVAHFGKLAWQRLRGSRKASIGEISISGDAMLARDFAALMADLDIDLEAMLADYIGDIPAYNLGRAVRRVLAEGQSTLNRIEDEAINYVRQGSPVIVPTEQAEDWMVRVDELRQGVDRAEQRIRRLEKQLGKGGH